MAKNESSAKSPSCGCKNVGTVDRVVRAVAGAGLLVAAFAGLGLMEGRPLGVAAAAAGLVLLGTAAVRVCPLYLPFKASTCPVRKE